MDTTMAKKFQATELSKENQEGGIPTTRVGYHLYMIIQKSKKQFQSEVLIVQYQN